jgi:hypothetical protein
MSKQLCSSSLIKHIDVQELEGIGNNIVEFLGKFSGPTRIRIPGKETSRCRILVTLLHGNEPSGFTALHQLLKQEIVPAVTIYCYLIAIEAAELKPVFSHRQVPGKRDYNRCFGPPYNIDDQGPVCKSLLEEIVDLKPEAVVDMHNTSGEGPSFGVTTSYDEKHDEIVSLFTDRLIVTNLRLGAIMETNTDEVPVVTIECGGVFEEAADRIAFDGLKRFFTVDELFALSPKDYGIELYYNPLRIELHQATSLDYGNEQSANCDITLKTEIEHHNFGLVTKDTLLGWVAADAMDKLAAFDAERLNHFKELYREENGGLYPRFNQKMFMITSNPEIARSDCLWYVALDK